MHHTKDLRRTCSPKMSQEKLGSLVGVGRTTVAMWECGKSEPSFEILKKIADIFNVSTDYLLGRTDEKKPTPVSGDGLNAEQRELIELYASLDSADRHVLLASARALAKARHAEQEKEQAGLSYAARKSDEPHAATGPDTDVEI